MPVAVVAVAAVVAITVLVLVALRHRSSRNDGVTAFRNHLRALSPDARRQVVDRMRHLGESVDDGTDES